MITGLGNQTGLWCWGLNPGLYACLPSTVPTRLQPKSQTYSLFLTLNLSVSTSPLDCIVKILRKRTIRLVCVGVLRGLNELIKRKYINLGGEMVRDDRGRNGGEKSRVDLIKMY